MADETREENSDLVDVSHRAAEGFFFQWFFCLSKGTLPTKCSQNGKEHTESNNKLIKPPQKNNYG